MNVDGRFACLDRWRNRIWYSSSCMAFMHICWGTRYWLRTARAGAAFSHEGVERKQRQCLSCEGSGTHKAKAVS